MEQRSLRLGDILDDYCPRERRVTNHAVVAMVEQDVKQTRCTTCDTEHVYKGGKAPRRKRPETTGALYKEVLAGITAEDAPPGAALAAPAEAVPGAVADAAAAAASQPVATAAGDPEAAEPDEAQTPEMIAQRTVHS